MRYWNYRFTKQTVKPPNQAPEIQYAIREVYYDDHDNIVAWTEDPIDFVGDTPEEVADSLRRALESHEKGVVDLDSEETNRQKERNGEENR